MTPLQKVAMGLVVVFLSARFAGYDALPDPLGWLLVGAGLVPARRLLPHGDTLLFLAVAAGLVSVPLVVPAIDDRLSPSGQWGVSAPQAVFSLLLCVSLASLCAGAGAPQAGRFTLLRTAYVAVLVGPVLVYGGGLDMLATPVAVLSVLANVALVYYTFAISRRFYGSTGASASSSRSRRRR